MAEAALSDDEVAGLESEMAKVCGVLNAATGQLVSLVAKVVATGAWQQAGICSPGHYVAWQCGLSPARARSLVSMANRLDELPATGAALRAGAISEDQAAVVCRHAPASTDAEMAAFARQATVSQLRCSLSRYVFAGGGDGEAAEDTGSAAPEEVRSVSFGSDEDGSWRLSARLPADQGAAVEAALVEARDRLFRSGEVDGTGDGPPDSPARVSWADALVGLAEGSLATAALARPHSQRHQVLVHLDIDRPGGPAAWVHGGAALPEALRRLVTCDASLRPVWQAKGTAVSVGRAQRAVPARTRLAVEERDRGCVVPGCDRTRWLQVHHVVHWEDGGPTDTANLALLCAAHHRAHHRGVLGIEGDADAPGGLVFADHRGRRLPACGRPVTPPQPPHQAAAALGIATDGWAHPCGERMDQRWLHFNEAS